MVKIEEEIPKKPKTHPRKLGKPIIHLTRPDNNELDASEYIDQTCHNTPRDSTSGKYVIKIPSRLNNGISLKVTTDSSFRVSIIGWLISDIVIIILSNCFLLS